MKYLDGMLKMQHTRESLSLMAAMSVGGIGALLGLAIKSGQSQELLELVSCILAFAFLIFLFLDLGRLQSRSRVNISPWSVADAEGIAFLSSQKSAARTIGWEHIEEVVLVEKFRMVRLDGAFSCKDALVVFLSRKCDGVVGGSPYGPGVEVSVSGTGRHFVLADFHGKQGRKIEIALYKLVPARVKVRLCTRAVLDYKAAVDNYTSVRQPAGQHGSYFSPWVRRRRC